MRKYKIWHHKKYKNRNYIGAYRRAINGERELVLTCTRNGRQHNIVFESHEAAKAQGWRAV